jgi:Zn-dependent peptidase ImmA (M78 family)
VLKANSGQKLTTDFIKFIEDYVEKVVLNFTNEQVLRLIVVAAHEYGHYQSFVRGNHDENLKRGLYIFQNKYAKSARNGDEYTWLVFPIYGLVPHR